ncbi:sulfite exporter TauE/SafE family protein [Telluria aromaticivorans]|uniref:Sulfite exporter TauE/SafE family protein n=1 Tax=Telluria aromaticivorans TaxID=2725995 RepID=A0A7Y2JYR7_9BURK|nr:sulfite exporter TauE/SafE family protein [Telluria aromaticivorans]NNG22878.1 sulfite exporter TauE/SafE family protein [Telluria aromaticivorans]
MSASLFPVFLVGLLGSVHCAGMCGGIVGALSLAPPRARGNGIVIRLRTVAAAPAGLQAASYNAGRIASYTSAGLLAGGLAQGASNLSALPALQGGAYVLANLLLAALGLHLMGAWSGIARLEHGGQLVWRHVRPLLARIGPPDTPGRMFAAGALWGWLPCAMVYSVLVTAMLSGSAVSGALVMLAFGLGTLPMMLALGLAGARLRGWLRLAAVRVACGATVLAFGLLGLARAAGSLPASWLQVLCVTPGMAP